ncbi:MAG: hypothetical protein ACRDTR_05150 [Rubrobacter sp.]
MPREDRSGNLPVRHSFALNPYEDARFTRRPRCEQATRLRKFVLLIQVKEFGSLALGKTCRFCTRCELIVAHQDELEHELATALHTRDPGAIGKEYAVLGTVDRKTWRSGLKGETLTVGEILDHVAGFEKEYELHYDPGGWRPS